MIFKERILMKEFDTICGIATPLGEGGISIIRVSGSDSLKIINKIFKGKNSSDILDMKKLTKDDGSGYKFITIRKIIPFKLAKGLSNDIAQKDSLTEAQALVIPL